MGEKSPSSKEIKMNFLRNEMMCELNRYLFWNGFVKGVLFVTTITLIIQTYKYFKNKDIKIEISERKEPKL